MDSADILKKIQQLPSNLQKEVLDFVDELIAKVRKKDTKLSLGWAGGLKEYRDQFTALELQHKALDWWGKS